MKRLLLWLIRWYRSEISPNTPPSCRFLPTCSAYALEAVEIHGALKGGALADSALPSLPPGQKLHLRPRAPQKNPKTVGGQTWIFGKFS